MQRKKKPLSPLAAVVLLFVLVLFAAGFIVFAFIGLIANPWGVLSGILLGSVIYYVGRWKD